MFKLLPGSSPATAALPDEAAPAVKFVVDSLHALMRYANEVKDTVQLYYAIRSAPSSRDNQGWIFIPAKQTIVALYNYRMVMDSIVTACTRRWPTIGKAINTKQMEEAKLEFREAFPHTKELRQCILHQAELTSTVERMRQTQLREDSEFMDCKFSAGGIISSSLINDVFIFTFQGKNYSLPIYIKIIDNVFPTAIKFVDSFIVLGVSARLLQLR